MQFAELLDIVCVLVGHPDDGSRSGRTCPE